MRYLTVLPLLAACQQHSFAPGDGCAATCNSAGVPVFQVWVKSADLDASCIGFDSGATLNAGNCLTWQRSADTTCGNPIPPASDAATNLTAVFTNTDGKSDATTSQAYRTTCADRRFDSDILTGSVTWTAGKTEGISGTLTVDLLDDEDKPVRATWTLP